MHDAADKFGSHKAIMNTVNQNPKMTQYTWLPGKYLNQDYFVPYHVLHALSSQEKCLVVMCDLRGV